jgi:hypothetical protein
MENKKSYYAIIPADIRYSDKLSASAKLLYGEITALCNEKGYCWANNSYFMDLYQAGDRSISRWLSELANGGFIELRNSDSKRREIRLSTPPKMAGIPSQKWRANPAKNGGYNNTVNNTKNRGEKTLSFLIELPQEVIADFVGKFNVSEKQLISKADDLHDYCQAKGKVYKNYKAFLRKAIKKDFGERLPEDQEKIARIKETQIKHEGSSPYASMLKNKMSMNR